MHNPAGFVLLTDEKYIQYFLDTFKSDEDIKFKINQSNKELANLYNDAISDSDTSLISLIRFGINCLAINRTSGVSSTIICM